MRGLTLTLILMLAATLAVAQDAKPAPTKSDVVVDKTTFTPQDLKPEDQKKIIDINQQFVDAQKDAELANTKLQLAQAKVDRLNEVQIPKLIEDFRVSYKLSREEWDFDLKSFTFNKVTKKDPK